MKISAVTYILDSLGIFGIIVGGYVASKSVYSDKISKQAAILIDTQSKRIDSLDATIKDMSEQLHQYREDNNKMAGELNAYKKLALVSPDVIAKLTNLLEKMTQEGVHIDTQKIDTQIVGKSK